MRHPLRLGLQGGVNHCSDPLGIVGGLPATTGCDLPKSRQPFCYKTFPPETDRFPIHFQIGSDGCLGFSVACCQYNPTAQGHLLRGSQRRHPLPDLLALIFRHDQHVRRAGHD